MTLSSYGKAQDVNLLAAFRSSYIDPETGKMCWDAVVLEIFDILKEIDPELDFSSIQQVKALYDCVGLLAKISTQTGQKFLATERESEVGVAMLIPLHEKDMCMMQ